MIISGNASNSERIVGCAFRANVRYIPTHCEPTILALFGRVAGMCQWWQLRYDINNQLLFLLLLAVVLAVVLFSSKLTLKLATILPMYALCKTPNQTQRTIVPMQLGSSISSLANSFEFRINARLAMLVVQSERRSIQCHSNPIELLLRRWSRRFLKQIFEIQLTSIALPRRKVI